MVFPGDAVVENPPANAGDMGSSPGLGGSHMPRSNWAREPQLLSLRIWSLCSATREAAIVRGPRTAMKSGPHLPQLEKALAQKRRPDTAKNKKKRVAFISYIIFLSFSWKVCTSLSCFLSHIVFRQVVTNRSNVWLVNWILKVTCGRFVT